MDYPTLYAIRINLSGLHEIIHECKYHKVYGFYADKTQDIICIYPNEFNSLPNFMRNKEIKFNSNGPCLTWYFKDKKTALMYHNMLMLYKEHIKDHI